MRAAATRAAIDRGLLACLVAAMVATGCGGDEPVDLPEVLLPTISNLGGPVMTHPQLVPIFYSDDPDAEPLSRFTQWVVTSRWLTEVGAEYGVGAGSVLGTVRKTEAAPDRITDPEIANLLAQGIADGSLPKPADGNLGEVLYIVFFPAHTRITFGGVDASCGDFGGYHLSARRGGVEIIYAVIATCPGFFQGLSTLEGRLIAASHEIIEAATDPIPVNRPAYQLIDPLGSWSGLGLETADLCTRSDESGVWREAGFAATRSWSNAAAAAGGDPCVPVSTGDPYFNVVVDGAVMPRIKPGEHETRRLIGWTSNGEFDWQISAQASRAGTPTVKLSDRQLHTRAATTLDISVPSTTTRGTILTLFVFSAVSQLQYHVLPMQAIVDVPCSSFPSCESCSAHIGCGFCTTNGRCETEGSSGSAESPCPPGDFLTWPGSCTGFCANHNTTCRDCSAQAGCGWCASGDGVHCVEASHEQGHPQTASCPYADWSFTPDYCPP